MSEHAHEHSHSHEHSRQSIARECDVAIIGGSAAGLAAALVAMGDAARALEQFDQAQKLGASPLSLAADRGLARDLLGQQAQAQADYRSALTGPDAAEARRRLALSLAISGDRIGAQTALAPLLQHSDVATNRVRAFILAIGGDAAGAGRALDRTMPGMSVSLDPFFRRLPGLTPAQKAAAVHFGIFPGSGTGTALASGGALPNPAPPGQGTPPGSGFGRRPAPWSGRGSLTRSCRC